MDVLRELSVMLRLYREIMSTLYKAIFALTYFKWYIVTISMIILMCQGSLHSTSCYVM